jgi:hypothetical protein
MSESVNAGYGTFKNGRDFATLLLTMRFTTLSIVLLITAAACQTTREMYYNATEKMGYAKRERLVDNVKAARDEQTAAKKQFATALEQFKSVVNFSGGDLEAMYNGLNKEYARCEDKADDVKGRIKSVKNVGTALFDEWKGEIAQMKDDPSLQQKNRELYDRTHRSYDELVDRMDRAAASMDPVLTRFKNRVLFIKGNLNAQAIASLKGTEIELGADIDRLIKEMEASIAEADQFIAENQASKS